MSEGHSDCERMSATYVPLPNTVSYNDWRRLEVPSADGFQPTFSASVIVPSFEDPEKPVLGLAGLGGHTYPRELFEVVIVTTVRSRHWNSPNPKPSVLNREGSGIQRDIAHAGRQ